MSRDEREHCAIRVTHRRARRRASEALVARGRG